MADGDATYAHESGEGQRWLDEFWPKAMEKIDKTTNGDFRSQELPLARIKKIMKLDDDVKMISQEAPMLFAKAAEIFISELALRAWVQTEETKRRTLQRNDISAAITKFDQFDFLIDIVPRDVDTAKTSKRESVADSAVQFLYQNQGQASQAQVIQLGAGGQFPAGAQVIQLQAPQGAAASGGQQLQISASQLQALFSGGATVAGSGGQAQAAPIVIQTNQGQQPQQQTQAPQIQFVTQTADGQFVPVSQEQAASQ